MLDPEEINFSKPIFVDSFLNAKETGAYIILNWVPRDPNQTVLPWKWRVEETGWRCVWEVPELSLVRGAEKVEVEASLVHDSAPDEEEVPPPTGDNEEGVPLRTEEEEEEVMPHLMEAWRNATDKETSQGREVRFMNLAFLRALVLECPIPASVSNATVLQLALHGFVPEHGPLNQLVYQRSGIPVRRGTFIKKDTLALCTMVTDIKQKNGDLLWPWVKFHAAMGFEQILVYVEEESMDDARAALRGLAETGAVTLVPFFFGPVSRLKKFLLQGAMEQHCLYRAKGHASWIGHNDVDEFFEVRNGLRLRNYLELIPPNTSGVSARMQYWGPPMANSPLPWWRSLKHHIPFPCDLTCKVSGYNGFNPKWIARPENVEVLSPHRLQIRHGALHQADPVNLRLDHLRHCDTNGFCSGISKPCEQDMDFMEKCIEALDS